MGMSKQATSSVISNFLKLSKHKKPYVHLSCFSPQRRNEIHQSAIHQFYCPFSPPRPPQNPKRKAFGAVLKNRPEKKWLQTAQPFVFPLNKASDKAGAWCTSIAGAWVCSRVHKQSHVSWQAVFFPFFTFTTPPGWEYNVLQHITASGQYLICSSMLLSLCSGRGLGMH